MDSEAIKFVFIGDTHNFVNDFSKQKEIIEKIKPKIILSENMQDISLISEQDYLKIIKGKKISEMVNFEEVENLINLCYNMKINLVGMDFRNFGFNERLQKIVKGELNPLNEDIKEINKIIRMRQKKHLDVLKTFEDKSEHPILVFIGTWHLKENSLIMKSLKNYKVIFPCDKYGKMLMKPSKAGDVNYCVRVKNG